MCTEINKMMTLEDCMPVEELDEVMIPVTLSMPESYKNRLMTEAAEETIENLKSGKKKVSFSEINRRALELYWSFQHAK